MRAGSFADLRKLTDLLLRAAWCCVDEGDSEAERFFRRKAAWKFEEALGSFDGVGREERAVLTYLVGELWRRIGDLRFETEGAWKRTGTTVDSLAKELRLALQYPEGAAVTEADPDAIGPDGPVRLRGYLPMQDDIASVVSWYQTLPTAPFQ